MVARKLKYFPDNKRFIIDYELSGSGRNMYFVGGLDAQRLRPVGRERLPFFMWRKSATLTKNQRFVGDPDQAVRAFDVRTLFTLLVALAASVRDSINRVAAVSDSALLEALNKAVPAS